MKLNGSVGPCRRLRSSDTRHSPAPAGASVRDLVGASKGKITLTTVQGFYGDHQSTICKHFGTLDAMVFNATRREAHITRGPGCLGRWQRFSLAKDS